MLPRGLECRGLLGRYLETNTGSRILLLIFVRTSEGNYKLDTDASLKFRLEPTLEDAQPSDTQAFGALRYLHRDLSPEFDVVNQTIDRFSAHGRNESARAFLHLSGGSALEVTACPRGGIAVGLVPNTGGSIPDLRDREIGTRSARRMTDAEIEHWASAYIRAQQEPRGVDTDHPFWWAIEQFMELGGDGVNPEDCWGGILAILAKDPPPEVLGMLSAGPLEDLIEYCGADFIDRIEQEAIKNPKFRNLLKALYPSGNAEVWKRVLAIRSDKSR